MNRSPLRLPAPTFPVAFPPLTRNYILPQSGFIAKLPEQVPHSSNPRYSETAEGSRLTCVASVTRPDRTLSAIVFGNKRLLWCLNIVAAWVHQSMDAATPR